jgi:hypothetical protein
MPRWIRRARPGLIRGLFDRRPYRRRKPGTPWHLRFMRSGHVPPEREDNAYQYGDEGRGEPGHTAAAK